MAKKALAFVIFSTAISAWANSCPLAMAMDEAFSLTQISKALQLKDIDNQARMPELNKLLLQFNRESKLPEKNVNAVVDKMADGFYDQAIGVFKAAITESEKIIDNGLAGPDIMTVIGQADQVALQFFKMPPEDPHGTDLSLAKNQVSRSKAYVKYVLETAKLIAALQSKLSKRCIPTDVAFEAQIKGKQTSFSKCSEVLANDPESKKWGGKILSGQCRHVVSCGSVKSADVQLSAAASWILDCDRIGSDCPDILKCAVQTSNGRSKVRSTIPDQGVR